MSDFVSPGIRRIIDERRRQIEVEGWTSEHDDEHVTGELADAAACYASTTDPRDLFGYPLWPWDPNWDKRMSRPLLVQDKITPLPTLNARIRELEKAGALIVAEIDRLTRLKDSM
jgi:hypothetical protein